jgi:hypothetical protein
MFKPVALATMFFALLASACAQTTSARPSTSISFEVTADPANHAAHLTCKKASSGECVVWIGDATASDHRSFRIPVGSSQEVMDDGKGDSLCAKPVEADLSWPGCVTSPSGATLKASKSIDYFFW